MVSIIPSILSTTEEDYTRKVDVINNSQSEIEWVHIDLMDNKFVQNQSVIPEVVKKYLIKGKKIELHLMVEDPLSWISQFKDLPTDRFIIHAEVEEELIDQAVSFIRSFGNSEIGLALNPETSISKLTELDLADVIDQLLIMSVHPGFGGQQFIPETLDKIQECSHRRSNYNNDFLIEVDGGIHLGNAKDIIEKGADNLVVGSHLFAGDFDENVKKIQETIRS